MKKYLSAWNLSRLLRLAIAVAIIVQGILVKDGMFITLGVLFSIMPVMNIGCGAGGTCNPRPSFRNPEDPTLTRDANE
ncbi:MAG: hypothetical protein KF870_04670 [Leadbetterella sp.]|nr:hypothetical protein [Leadbetterella sp.]